jgi:hypothetical protein
MEGVNLARPDKAKPKGRTIKSSEQQVLKLGAKGAKKMSRKCQKCGIADGHNIRTCLTVEDNRIRLANLSGRKRGRSPGSRNKIIGAEPQWNETSTSKKRTVCVEDDESSGRE